MGIPKGGTVNTLTMGDLLALADWLKKKKGRIAEFKLNIREVADMATKELPFVVTYANIQGLAKHVGVEFKRGGARGAPAMKTSMQRILTLAIALDKLGDSLGFRDQAVQDLIKDMTGDNGDLFQS